MLHSVTVTNYLKESLVMELAKPWKSGMNIKNIDGIGPGKGHINTKAFSVIDGSSMIGANVESRNIVLNIGFYGDDIETIRQKTYKYFPIKHELELSFKTDNRISTIKGYVESNEPNIFSKEEETSISIICPFPWFKGSGDLLFDFRRASGLFEFPFSNESLTEKLLIMGQIEEINTKSINYEGELNTGIIGEFIFKEDTGNIRVFNLDSQNGMIFNMDKLKAIIGGEIKNNDKLHFSTIPGDKYAVYESQNTFTNVLNAVDSKSVWFTINKGSNNMGFVTDKNQESLNLLIKAPVLYQGV